MTSIHQRLSRTLIIIVPALTAISGIVIYLTCRARLDAEFNQELITQTRAIGDSLMREGTGDLEFYFDEASSPEFRNGEQSSFFELWRVDGTVYRKSASLGNRDLGKILAPSSAPVVKPMELDGENDLRAAALRVVPHLDLDDIPPVASRPPIVNDQLYLVVARNTTPLAKTLGTIWSALFWSGIALITTIIGTVAIVVRVGLAPLRKLATEADTIDADTLHQRLSNEALPEELMVLSKKFNELLARLEGAFTRERSFASAAAHELRTPISELRALAEVALRWPDETDARRGFQDTLQIAQRMEKLVLALLAIVRTEARISPGQEADIELNDLVPALWQPYEGEAVARSVSFSFQPVAHPTARSEPMLLRALIDNLLSNAAAHTPAGGSIECSVEEEGGLIRFSLSNTCHELSSEDLPRMFEPFWRKDESRTGGRHFGLGLSLVATYATVLHLPVRMKLEPEKFKVTVGPIAASLTPAPMTPAVTG